ncbi:M4 family metallopeptidase [Zooshikella marina]|uniref:GEVED domain-containing protein n=1 Tax=Zooshikella ganghwensis TaxID=202772 RepID=UPI001BAF90D7|nr:GEVED domain-containing protein [Zooshikella ganghwensis]MBU2706924.1 M4 family metallopeptidase [Zooshikella ganghwensis]
MRDHLLFLMTLLLLSFNSVSAERLKPLEVNTFKIANGRLYHVDKKSHSTVINYSAEHSNNKILLKRAESNYYDHSDQYEHYQQIYRGIDIEGSGLILSKNNHHNAKVFYQKLFKNLERDIVTTAEPPDFTPDKVKLWLVENYLKRQQAVSDWQLTGYTVKPAIYIDSNDKAHYSYKVEFLARSPSIIKPIREKLFLDPYSQTIIARQDLIKYESERIAGSGYGGNKKVGYRQYNQPNYLNRNDTALEANTFLVSYDGVATCTMDQDNVQVLDASQDDAIKTPYRYPCSLSGQHDETQINEAYGVKSDAQFHGQVAYQLFDRLPFIHKGPLGKHGGKKKPVKIRVHSGSKLDDGFWDGEYINLGDGDKYFYPLVSLDSITHELAHGFLETYSKLEGDAGHSFGISESFADIAGEAAEYLLGKTQSSNLNDWFFNKESFKQGKAARYFEKPSQDGKSIDSAKHYHWQQNGHYSAGVFNKAFYHLINDNNGWTPLEGFELFALAAVNCWGDYPSFTEAAQCVLDQAKNLNVSDTALAGKTIEELEKEIMSAFAKVDVYVLSNTGSHALFDYSVSYREVTFTNLSHQWGRVNGSSFVKWHWDFGDGLTQIETNSAALVVHQYKEDGSYKVTLTVEDSSGNQYTYSKTISLTPHYCTPSGNPGDQDFIKQVSLVSTALGQQLGPVTLQETSGYGQYLNTPFKVNAGENFTIKLNKESNSYSHYWSVFIDSNGDGDFADEGELITEFKSKENISSQITIPLMPANASTRMRIAMSWGTKIKNPCDSLKVGEFEDYLLINGGTDTHPDPLVSFSFRKVENTVYFKNTSRYLPDEMDWQWQINGQTFSGKPAFNSEISHQFEVPGEGEPPISYRVSLVLNGIYTSDVAEITFENEADTSGLPQGYCNAKGSYAFYAYINKFGLGAFLNSSGNSGGYQNYTDQTISLKKGNTYYYALTPYYSWGKKDSYAGIWIDLNRNGRFEDNEKLVTESNFRETIADSFLIPVTASTGLTKMRVILKSNERPSACGTFGHFLNGIGGEVEDYIVNLQ